VPPRLEPGASSFAAAVIAWQASAGRHGLPWQQTADPYRIWVSEIMLQQTQVTSVLGRYERFLGRFPRVQSLAQAQLDEVLALWSGLGYYSRARNLHACAREVMARHDGRFPRDVKSLAALPGIGRSTAAAIAVFSGGEAAAILDGNVKRVLTRAFALEGWPGHAAVERQLWCLAESLFPVSVDPEGWRAYTQGLMDLGATVCTPKRPSCTRCPLSAQCLAYARDQVGALPTPRPPREVAQRHAHWALFLYSGQVLLEVRPAQGIWGGLWSLPELKAPAAGPASRLDSAEVVRWSHARLTGGTSPLCIDWVESAEMVRHVFTHFKLQAQVWEIHLRDHQRDHEQPPESLVPPPESLETPAMSPIRWLPLTREAIQAAPLATPVRTVLLARCEG
jgi:A/G-specific adenine glycosylase